MTALPPLRLPSAGPDGALDTAAAVIERYNTLGETMPRSFTLSLTGSGGYIAWIITTEVIGDNPSHVAGAGEPEKFLRLKVE